MIQKIKSQIGLIDEALAWIKRNKSEHYEQRFMQLVEERRKLYKLLAAENDNPGIAAFGKSQVGKSYLMNCILQKDGNAFKVKANGTYYDFIEQINPITDNTEATGVVTRFSSFSRDENKYVAAYPLLMKTLSVSDIITILSDGYYHDLKNWTSEGENAINEEADAIRDKYINLPEVSNSPLKADDILDMKDYFARNINNAQSFNKSYFFDKVALVANKIPSTDWESVFSILWHRNADINHLFNHILKAQRSLSYAKEVYLPIEAVLHEGIKPNTIMSVDCLMKIFNTTNQYFTDAYIKTDDSKTLKKIEHLSKSDICAICAEIVIKIEDEFLSNSASYDFSDMDAESQAKLKKGNIEMNILKENDLLDFPGARSRLNLQIAALSSEEELVKVFLRGKVAYLFNKYNESSAINVLLYCHDQYQNDVTNLYILLDDWVRKYVGETPEERQSTIESTGNIPPLFYIGTKFNMDMAVRPTSTANEKKSIDSRWADRFSKVLYDQCLNSATPNWWLNNWTAPGNKFKNSYLLRDFKYSGPKASKLYKGFEETGHEYPREKANTEGYMTDEYYQQMRNSFINSPDASMFFDDRALSWDVAASRNNDGSVFIIENLSVVAGRLLVTRERQFANQLDKCKTKLLDVLKEYHISEDIDEILRENIRKANSIIREMDFTCNEDNYFFGHLLQALQVTETSCLQIIHQLINSGELGEKNNNFTDYEIILRRCRDFKGCNNAAECWERLEMMYGLRSLEEAQAYLVKRNVDHNLLFSKNFKKKLNSCLIADRVYERWQKKINSQEFMSQLLSNQLFDGVVMSALLDNIIQTSNYLKLNDLMAEAIAEYVNVIAVFTINESLVADILSSTINQFVIDLGYSLLTEKDCENAKKIAYEYQLPVFDYIGKTRQEHFEEEELTTLFDDLTDNPKAMTTSFEESYYTWLEYMCVSFIAHLDVPDYDKEANRQLTEIINNISISS
ncbi:MAG: putative virulence factor [Prevotella sp.]|nr:putative virulence factor [Prevotella sp.]